MTLTTFVLDALLFVVAWVHVLLAPYTKVEESFNLHAVHDVVMYGVGPSAISKYDHVVFPGAVPRTFIGSVLLAWISTPMIRLGVALNMVSSKFNIQILVRLVLATLNCIGLVFLRRAVYRRFGLLTSHLFSFITLSQFHLLFWIGRTLPNMFALLPVTIANAFTLSQSPNAEKPRARHVKVAIALMTFTTVVFRSEVLLLLGPLALQSLLNGWVSFSSVIMVGLLSGLPSIALTTLVDSYFWSQKLLWPELYGLYFNVYLDKSSEWGVSPPYAYFTTHLPKLLLSGSFLALIGLLVDRKARSFTGPSLLFVALISSLAHKEWRFIIYTVPVLNVAAARGARAILDRKRAGVLGKDTMLFVGGLLLVNAAASIVSLWGAVVNYPGGTALCQFNQQFGNISSAPVHVHISNLAAQTGASLFLQANSPPYLAILSPPAGDKHWIYSKVENLTTSDLTRGTYTHLIVETPLDPSLKQAWNVVGSADGFAAYSVGRWLQMAKRMDLPEILEGTKKGGPFRPQVGEQLIILERK